MSGMLFGALIGACATYLIIKNKGIISQIINGNKTLIIKNKETMLVIVNGGNHLIIKNQEMQLVIVNGKNNMNYQKKQPLVANLPVLLARVQGRVVRVAQGVA